MSTKPGTGQDQVLLASDITVDHAIICIRSLYDAAESRRRIQSIHGTDALVNGGLWETTDPKEQEAMLGRFFYNLIYRLTERDIPITFLHFPRFAKDATYFVDKLSNVFRDTDPKLFNSSLKMEMRPELITNFYRAEEN